MFSFKTEYLAILDVHQIEKEKLLGQLKTFNDRLVLEREKVDSLQEAIRKQNIKYSRLDHKYSNTYITIG